MDKYINRQVQEVQQGDSVELDKIVYVITGKNTCKVTNGKMRSGDINIPASISVAGRSFTVKEIGEKSFGRFHEISIYDKDTFKTKQYTSIRIPNAVTTIGDHAFCGCDAIEEFYIPNSVTTIGNYAFYGCKKLKNIVIPDSVISIGNGAFGECYCLTNIQIPNSVSSIGNEAFYECKNLHSIDLSNRITSISDETFCRCSRLAKICIPEGVTKIGFSAFADCFYLKSITIPSSVLTIEELAFYIDLDGLLSYDELQNYYKTIYCLAKKPPEIDGFIHYKGGIHVPSGCGDLYRQHNNWKNFIIIDDL